MRSLIASLDVPRAYSGTSALQEDAVHMAPRAFGLTPYEAARSVDMVELLQHLAHTRASGEGSSSVLVESRAEPGEGLELLELAVGQPQVACDGAVRRQLRLATHARYRQSNLHRRQNAFF